MKYCKKLFALLAAALLCMALTLPAGAAAPLVRDECGVFDADTLADLEEQADQLYAKVIRDLHVNDYDNPMRVQVWTNLFDSMEACCDACELAADVMNTIMLKNV